MDIALGKPAENFERAREWTAAAAQNGSALVAFPELWSTGYDLENWRAHAAKLGAGLFGQLSDLAAEFKISIAGSILEEKDDKCYNTLTLFDAAGNLTAVYRKIHLFRLMSEDQWLAPGEATTLTETAWGPTGLGICYDLRFAEIFRKYAIHGAQIVILPAEWPSRRAYHWQTLIRARAIENQMYMVAINRVGESKGEHFGGQSAVIDPWGEVVAEGGSDPALIHAEIDLAKVAEVRRKIPVFADRRPDVY
jgi:predicted amidohydrolase